MDNAFDADIHQERLNIMSNHYDSATPEVRKKVDLAVQYDVSRFDRRMPSANGNLNRDDYRERAQEGWANPANAQRLEAYLKNVVSRGNQAVTFR